MTARVGSSLPTVERVAACPMCHGEGDDAFATPDLRLGVPGTFTYRCCRRCGVHWLADRFTRENIHHAYPQSEYYSYGEPPPPEDHWMQRAVNSRYGAPSAALARLAGRIIQAYPPAGRPGCVLDIGCGSGARLHRLARAGWRCAGMEVNADAVAAARASGLDVRPGSAESLPFDDNSFDAVLLAHSIEHSHSPRAALREVARVLRPDGTLVLTTPNTRSAARAVWGRYWVAWDPSRHLVLFDRTSLVTTLREEGFVIERCRGTASGSGWIDSSMLRFGRPRSDGMVRLLRHVAAGFTLLTNALPWADEMEVTARLGTAR